jgi:uncharacterized protein (DUF2225 family)
MTTLQRIQLTCPICSWTFSSQTVVSASLLGRRTDFHELAAGAQPLPYLVHTCSTCGYSGNVRDFGDDAVPSPALRDHVWGELAPTLPSGPLAGSEKYELAAKVALWQGAEPWRVGDLFLRAAWCCVEEGDTEAERYFRRYAAWGFEDALASYDTVDREERAVLTYLVGELWRRIGDEKQARWWFDRVPSEVTDAEGQQWIVEAARQQRDHPREWFA